MPHDRVAGTARPAEHGTPRRAALTARDSIFMENSSIGRCTIGGRQEVSPEGGQGVAKELPRRRYR
jgi:hypothetical protein